MAVVSWGLGRHFFLCFQDAEFRLFQVQQPPSHLGLRHRAWNFLVGVDGLLVVDLGDCGRQGRDANVDVVLGLLVDGLRRISPRFQDGEFHLLPLQQPLSHFGLGHGAGHLLVGLDGLLPLGLSYSGRRDCVANVDVVVGLLRGSGRLFYRVRRIINARLLR